jgi:uncharacterized protein YbjT (DUF2867 family)
MILVIGSTGKVGQHLIAALKAAGAPLKALARSEASAQALAGQGVPVVPGDLGDPGSLKAALAGADALFLLSATSRFAPLEIAAIDAAKGAGVKKVVKLSALGASVDAASPLLRHHALAERHLEASGLGFTVLRPTFFQQNWVAFFSHGIKAGQPVYTNAGDGRMGWVDTRDVAAVAAKALTEPGHEGLVYDLTGPESLSNAEAGAKLAARLGREVPVVSVPDGAAFAAMQGMGMDPWYAYGMTALNQAVRRGASDFTTGTVELVTGRPPRTLDAFFEENLPAFQG